MAGAGDHLSSQHVASRATAPAAAPGRQADVGRHGGPRTDGAATTDGLHVCAACRSPLVMPVAWEAAGPGRWAITRECPNCGWWEAGAFEEAVVERFDEELDRGTEALVRDLLRLVRANMEEDVERLISALRAGALLPEDF